MSNNVYHDQLFQRTVEAVHRELIDCQELSAREAYIVYLFVVKRLNQKQIATKLSLSIDTVDSHFKNIYKKINVHCQGEMVNWYNRKYFHV